MVKTKLKVTIDIFSGRKNPVIELEGKDAEEALSRLKPSRSLDKDEISFPTSVLGYRGLIIEQVGASDQKLPKVFQIVNSKIFGTDLAHRVSDENFEDFIIDKLKIKNELKEFIAKEVSNRKQLDAEYKPEKIVFPIKKACPCAAIYEPDWWNDGGQKQSNNNCFNYSTNYRTDTFAQPGKASGAMYTSLTCASVRPAAEKDGLINKPDANNKCPTSGHLVALVMAPDYDYHWYRKGQNGYWTHKPGGTAVTNRDNSGALITDPRTANRGPYTEFCTFMITMHGHIKIK